MKEEIIRLQSRYNTDNKLVRIGKEDSRFYKLICEHHCRIIFNPEDPEDIYAIDPSGGPYIAVGETVNGYKVKKIYNSYTIEFDDDISGDQTE